MNGVDNEDSCKTEGGDGVREDDVKGMGDKGTGTTAGWIANDMG